MAEGGEIILRGHSDSGGSDDGNLRASQARAEAVRDWLVDNGIDSERITVIAFGEQNPAAPNALPDGSPNAYHPLWARLQRYCDEDFDLVFTTSFGFMAQTLDVAAS